MVKSTMTWRNLGMIVFVSVCVQVPILALAVAFFRRPAADVPPPPPPRTSLTSREGSIGDTDTVPVQLLTLADGHAWFVVGTDTASWPPLVWMFEPVSGVWVRQRGAL